MFVFSGSFGNDRVIDFEGGVDSLDFSSSGLGFGDLTISASGGDTLIEDGLGNSITLVGINPANIAADDFVF